MDGQKIALTQHAAARLRQRGVLNEPLRLVMEEGGFEIAVGGGCSAVSLSRERCAQLEETGVAWALLDKAARIVVVLSAESTLVTVLNRARSDRRYRHGVVRQRGFHNRRRPRYG
jgi:hypothetical protein